MVKIGILGADSLMAGEIIRILLNHPEIELISLYAPALFGRNISSAHHGLIGETSLIFTDKINPSELDLLILDRPTDIGANIINQLPQLENLKIIPLSKDIIPADSPIEAEPGLSEVNRKALVRGARIGYVLSPLIAPALIALTPLADYLLLNSQIEIDVNAPKDLIEHINVDELKNEISSILLKHQASFSNNMNLNIHSDNIHKRGEITKIRIKNSLPLDEIEKIYSETYSDHNFTYITLSPVGTEEVVGTQKVVLTLSKPDPEILEINAVSDARMRGGAGDAIHVLNLFFGLHEKTGLHFKASTFSPYLEQGQ